MICNRIERADSIPGLGIWRTIQKCRFLLGVLWLLAALAPIGHCRESVILSVRKNILGETLQAFKARYPTASCVTESDPLVDRPRDTHKKGSKNICCLPLETGLGLYLMEGDNKKVECSIIAKFKNKRLSSLCFYDFQDDARSIFDVYEKRFGTAEVVPADLDASGVKWAKWRSASSTLILSLHMVSKFPNSPDNKITDGKPATMLYITLEDNAQREPAN
jgi:hypothetical protein